MIPTPNNARVGPTKGHAAGQPLKDLRNVAEVTTRAPPELGWIYLRSAYDTAQHLAVSR